VRQRPGFIVIVLASCGLVASFMQTLVIPLIPSLPTILHTNASDASWVITITLLAAAVILGGASVLAVLKLFLGR